ncbi:MAG TPA: hypothetical protein VGL77_18315 [Armatimonadota bacterium]|jgi:hypothetical protein
MGAITLDRVIFDIIPDTQADSPRHGETLGIMVCWHRRYVLGDPHAYPTPQVFAAAIPQDEIIALPMYLFDHSGLSLSTSSERFRACDSAAWDWGQVGYIYVRRADVRRAYGVTRISRRVRTRVLDVLRGEVDVYDQYLRGDVYAYSLTDRQTGALLDSCGNFFGENPQTNGMGEHYVQ